MPSLLPSSLGENTKYSATNINKTGTTASKISLETKLTDNAPTTPPTNDAAAIGRPFFQSIKPLRAKETVAENVAAAACSLLVAIADTGGIPANKKYTQYYFYIQKY